MLSPKKKMKNGMDDEMDDEIGILQQKISFNNMG